MHYKTMILAILEDRPQMHERLRRERTLLSTMGRYARELRASHEAWKGRLAQERTADQASLIAGEALEMALAELLTRLPPESPPSDDFSLEEAIAFVRRGMPDT